MKFGEDDVASAHPLSKRAVCAEGPPRPGPPSGRLQMAELASGERVGGHRAVSHPPTEGQALLGERHPGVTRCSEMRWCTSSPPPPFSSVYPFLLTALRGYTSFPTAVPCYN